MPVSSLRSSLNALPLCIGNMTGCISKLKDATQRQVPLDVGLQAIGKGEHLPTELDRIVKAIGATFGGCFDESTYAKAKIAIARLNNDFLKHITYSPSRLLKVRCPLPFH